MDVEPSNDLSSQPGSSNESKIERWVNFLAAYFMVWRQPIALSSEGKNIGGPDNRNRKLSVKAKVLFASGAIQEGVVSAGGIVTLIFYNQVLGVSPALAGIAFAIASVSDAITDPLIGTYSDQFKSKIGRRHPFMFFSALPLAVSFFFLYQPPQELSATGYFWWLTVFLVLVRVSQTFYLVPHDALGAELTDNYEERSSIFGYNAVAVAVFAASIAMFAYVIVFPSTEGYDNGLLNKSRYIILASAGSITIFFSVIVCALGTMDQIPYLHNTKIRQKISFKKYVRELTDLITNRNYIAACLSLLTCYASLGIITICSGYAYIYVFEIPTEDMIWGGLAKMPGMVVALPVLAFMSKFFEKKTTFIIACAWTAIMVSTPFFFGLFDLLPPPGTAAQLWVVYGTLALGFAIFPVTQIIIDSQLVDVADDHEYRTNRRSEGVIFSVRSFGNKATAGVGSALAGFGLEMIEFPENAKVGGLEPATMDGLLIINGPIYLGFYLLACVFMAFYKIDKEYHSSILSELEVIREKKSLQDET